MHLNRMFLARVFALSMTLWSLPSTGFSQDSDSCDQQLLQYCRGDGNTYQEAKGYMECLRRNRNKFSGECGTYVDEVLGEFDRGKPCMEDYLRLCGIDLVKMRIKDPQQSYMETMQQCMIMRWDEFSEACRREYQENMEAVGWDEEAIRKEASRLKAREKARGLVWVKGVLKPVMAEAREGDLIWYVAKVRKKKVLDRYPFCPEVKGQGLKLRENNMGGICYYMVTAPWEKEMIRELETANVLKDIPYCAGGVRQFFRQMRGNVLGERREESDRGYKAVSAVVKILDQYSHYCPENFETEIWLRSEIIANVSQYTGYGAVMCERKDYDTCNEGYIKSYYDYGYFGCVKYASCQETNPRYIETIYGQAGDSCFECDAGGCLDQDSKMFETLGVGTICRVNYKDPARTPGCGPYKK